MLVNVSSTSNQYSSLSQEFDYEQQFWSEIAMSPGSLALCGASGGADASAPDPQNTDLNTTFYVAGGPNNQTPNVYDINISGVESSNNIGSLFGSFLQVPFPQLSSINRQASTVMPGGNIVYYGGCNGTSSQGLDCASQAGSTLDISSNRAINANICPAPRVGASLVPNLNTFASTYATQAFLLLGLFDQNAWNDSNALKQGEVVCFNFN